MEWISVNESLPDNGDHVICVDINGRWWECWFVIDSSRGDLRKGFNYITAGEGVQSVYHIPLVTHWMKVDIPDEEARKGVLEDWNKIQEEINESVNRILRDGE